jgi:hypothetical protein
MHFSDGVPAPVGSWQRLRGDPELRLSSLRNS